jgi:pilus assembly protein FimV
MAGVHRLLLGLASSSVLYSGLVPALGLGGITLHSALNEPLDAEIQLIAVGDLSAEEVRVRLASEADFVRSGVERIFFLNDLRFTPLFRGNHSIIRVTSSKAIREPYLNFVIELARPGGQLLREYTLLIDPPSSSAYRRVAELPSYSQPSAVQARPPKRVTQVPVAIQGNSYRVVAGDSLWLIAKRLMATQGQRSQQTLMDDIQALNPQAFIAGDSSRLRLGVNLVLPDSLPAPLAETSPSAALTAPDTAAATRSTQAPINNPISPPGAPADIALAQSRVDAELAAHALQNRQLQASMLALQVQLSALQEQMQAKDQQLELLRADLALNPKQALHTSSAPPLAAVPVPVPPVAMAAPSEPQGSLWWWLLGGSGALLGVFATLLWRARGRRPGVTDADSGWLPVTAEAVLSPSPLIAAVAVAPVSAPAPVAAPPSIKTTPTPARATHVTADALEGANIYITYGRFSEALGVLRKGVEAEPQRLELRLRMLEVLGELGDSAGFTQEEAILRQQGADPTQLNQLWTRFAHLLVAEPEVVLDDAVLLPDEQPLDDPAPTSPVVDDFQLNLEDLSLDADWDLVSPFNAPVSTRSKAALTPVANDPAFCSDLQQLPEVSEVQLEQNALNPFADWPATVPAAEQIIEEEVVDAFATESLKNVGKTAVASLEHLAASRENLVKLNKALAYIAQGNLGSACSILNEVISDGDAQQQQQARELLAKIA